MATQQRCLGGLLLLGLGTTVYDIGRAVVLALDHHHLIDGSGNLETVLIFHQHDVLALETGDLSTTGLAKKLYFISYLHTDFLYSFYGISRLASP